MGTSIRSWSAIHGFAAGGVFPWIDVDYFVAGEMGVFGFEAIWVVAGAALLIGDSTELEEVLRDGVAPDDGVAGLVLKAGEHVGVKFRVDAAFERLPFVDELPGLRGTFIVRVV